MVAEQAVGLLGWREERHVESIGYLIRGSLGELLFCCEMCTSCIVYILVEMLIPCRLSFLISSPRFHAC